ncbi:hypothetical protein PORY_000978 [Pneumocystis oryctolagi]|uniref:Uncharacterized protein n=1 Tax=Pneumocystis oryctolagi TaxID=42067 RepID=A0ACB7CEC0_9ASCO|nr:hypothetical protein PORY_000978 [Pneumocystis oryctolagi]
MGIKSGGTRLERLILLLDTGSTQVIRQTAAQQLAAIQKDHPYELYNILEKLIPYIRSKSWDTRMAAVSAISAVIKQVPLWDPDVGNAEHEELKLFTEKKGSLSVLEDNYEEFFNFETFDISLVIKNGQKLLGSDGKEYDFDPFDIFSEENLSLQKKNLISRLGLGGEYVDGHNLFNASDFTVPINDVSLKLSEDNPVTPLMNNTTLSARQRNAMKRKAKNSAKNNRINKMCITSTSVGTKNDASENTIFPLKTSIKQENLSDSVSVNFQLPSSCITEHKSFSIVKNSTENLEWPFKKISELLKVDLFHPRWEVRHGAAMGLREIIKIHGKGAGRIMGFSKAENNKKNKMWLEDAACRLTCIFALDHFGDYISDQVVAPIRESVSQTLAALLIHVDSESVKAIYRILYRLVFQQDMNVEARVWEVVHGGMLGLKYLVAVRKDVVFESNEVFNGVIQAVFYGLKNYDDDVRSVSAAILIPIAFEFVENRLEAVNDLMNTLWVCLSDLRDDLSTSTVNIMDLLSKLCSFPKVIDIMKNNAMLSENYSFSFLVPKLFPFLRHTITNVRKAVIKALQKFSSLENDEFRSWIDGRTLRLIFQNMLVEQNSEILGSTLDLWNMIISSITPGSSFRFYMEYLSHFLPTVELLMTPIGIPRHPYPMEVPFLDPSGDVNTFINFRENVSNLDIKSGKKQKNKKQNICVFHNIDKPMIQGDIDLLGTEVIVHSRVTSAKALGFLISKFPDDKINEIMVYLLKYFSSPFSTPRFLTAIVFQSFCKNVENKPDFLAFIQKKFTDILNDQLPSMFANLVPYMKIVRSQCHALCNTFIENGNFESSDIPHISTIVQGEIGAGSDAFGLEDAERIVDDDFNRLHNMISSTCNVHVYNDLVEVRKNVQDAIKVAKNAKFLNDVQIMAAIACTLVSTKELPKKLNPIIRAIMDSIKNEENLVLQTHSAESLTHLVDLCSSSHSGAIDKLIGNLCTFLCLDTSEIPEFHCNKNLQKCILSLKKDQEDQCSKDVSYERNSKEIHIRKNGAKLVLINIVETFGKNLFEKIPKLYNHIFKSIEFAFKERSDFLKDINEQNSILGQNIIDGLSILRILVSHFNKSLYPLVVDHLKTILKALECEFSVVRYAAAKCLATICNVITIEGMNEVISHVLSLIKDADNVIRRQGAVELIYHLVQIMGTNMLPYVVFFIIPILGRMNDSDNDIRIFSTTTFAALVKLVPLESGIPDPPGISDELLKNRDSERKFISQILDGNKFEPFSIPVCINANLRKYQQEGVNWLAFLNRYQLHGILCDDMGLGKTLQSICIIASDHFLKNQEHESKSKEFQQIPSLVICPPTLSRHWQHEFLTYAPFMKTLVYIGHPSERVKLRNSFEKYDVVITSYDICRNDSEEFSKRNWNYCVLDEGHIIKNAKAKLTKAIKLIKANYRLILSGTPIQNNVLELWSLFDFLMPGFLGTQKSFHEKFVRPIAASRDSKVSSREQEAGALALEALHKQVLPFLLRRLKEDVLDDLPPKIIQDYHCDLSPIQKQLYEEFTKTQISKVIEHFKGEKIEKKSHIFQALQYMRKLSNSPALVLNKKHPQYEKISLQLQKQNSSIYDIEHSPKLMALRNLLLDCGICLNDDTLGIQVNQHRALIFCQLKDMLNMIEDQVFKKLLPTVSYLRLDGDTDVKQRYEIAQKFNSDFSIDVLLLTTHVGGLGLNLTGADTVIFVEHDWNPMKDLQAMDRAHRIGQKNVVNVYRLITKGTLEEKIMSLQRFKLNIASSVINQQNFGLSTMDTGQILDLFTANCEEQSPDVQNANKMDILDSEGNFLRKNDKNILEDLDDLWDSTQYEESYDLDEFISSLPSIDK